MRAKLLKKIIIYWILFWLKKKPSILLFLVVCFCFISKIYIDLKWWKSIRFWYWFEKIFFRNTWIWIQVTCQQEVWWKTIFRFSANNKLLKENSHIFNENAAKSRKTLRKKYRYWNRCKAMKIKFCLVYINFFLAKLCQKLPQWPQVKMLIRVFLKKKKQCKN